MCFFPTSPRVFGPSDGLVSISAILLLTEVITRVPRRRVYPRNPSPAVRRVVADADERAVDR